MTDTETTQILATLRKQFEQDCKDEKKLREEAEKDLKFVAGDQWDEVVKSRRIAANRPALTFARCHTFVQQVANEARQNKPQIKFVPTEDNDDDTADIYEGLARHIQYDSEAQESYETAVDYQAGGGFGYTGFIKEYCDNESWDQDIKVRTFNDPFAVYGILYPACFGYLPKHAFVVDSVPTDDFKREWPDSDIRNFTEDDYARSEGWVTGDTVRVAEYWYIEEKSREIKRKNPATGEEETRIVTDKTVKFFKTNGVEILPGTEAVWQDEEIPIWAVLGKKLIVNRRPHLFSVVRHQRDPQQLINIYKTRIAETLSVAPVSPWLLEEGTIEGHKAEWDQLNTRVLPYLQYKGTNLNGQKANVPQRQAFESPIRSLSEAAAQEIDDMKATAGIFDASLGAKGNETSGIGIARRQQQSDSINLHFMDNLARAYSRAGKALARLIPVTYDGARMVRILGEDETPKIVKINQEFEEGNKTKNYKIGGEGVAKFDVIVTMGKAFSSKRMESFDMIGQVIQAAPNMLPMIGDIYFKNSDVAGSDQLAERFKKMLPPNLQDDQEESDVVIPPQVKQTLDQLTQQHQMLTEANQQLTQEVQTQASIKQMELASAERMKQMDIDGKIRLELLRIEAERDIAEIGAKVQDALQRQKLDADLNNKLMVQNDAQAHEVSMRAAEVGHEVAMADKGHQQAQEMQANQPEPQTQD